MPTWRGRRPTGQWTRTGSFSPGLTLTSLLATALASASLTTAVGFLPGLRSYDQYATLASVGAQTTVISGGADLVTPPSHARDMADPIAGATHLHLPAAGHMLLHEAPHVVTDAISRTIATLISPARQSNSLLEMTA